MRKTLPSKSLTDASIFVKVSKRNEAHGLQFLDGVEVDEEELRAAGNDSDVERDENEHDEQAEDLGDDPHPPAVNTEENHDWMTKDPSRPPVRNKTTTHCDFRFRSPGRMQMKLTRRPTSTKTSQTAMERMTMRRSCRQ